jgi:hypothetical protein
MHIEKWKDIAFGSDYGLDFQQFLEQIQIEVLTLKDVYKLCDLQKYFDEPALLLQRKDNNVTLYNGNFEQFVHYEDAVIALTAVVVESEMNGNADLSEAYGSKKLIFNVTKEELHKLHSAIAFIHSNPQHFILFDMLDNEAREETLTVMAEIIDQLQNSINKK